jgi:hypothetical protein
MTWLLLAMILTGVAVLARDWSRTWRPQWARVGLRLGLWLLMLGCLLRGAGELLAQFHTAFPDAEMCVEEQIAEEDKVATRWRFSGTHRVEVLGIPPTGKSVAVTGISIYRLAGGRVTDDRGEDDALGLMRQLGMVPAPAPAAAH